MKKLLAIPAAAALVAFAALLGTAGTASASSVATTVVAARQPSVQPAEVSLVFGGYYSTELQWEISGAGQVGLVLSGGKVVDYQCIFDGEPGPLGPWELWLLVEPLSCHSVPATHPQATPAVRVC